MGILSFFQRKKKDEGCDPEKLFHEVRNAVLGVQLERRNLWKAVDASDRRIRAHLERIENALRQHREEIRNEG